MQFLAEHGLSDAVRTAQVPATAPRSRKLWAEWTSIWPLAWRPPAHEAGTPQSTSAVSQSEAEQMAVHMQSACALLAQSPDACNAAIIVDPADGSIVATGVDQRATHPLRHAVMVALAGAAEWNLSLWPRGAADANSASAETDADMLVADRPVAADARASKVPRLGSAAAECARHHTRRNSTSEGDTVSQCAPHDGSVARKDEAIAPAQALLASAQRCAKAPSQNQPYLCTGFDCYVAREPCVMCAMALTHSRLRRVAYRDADSIGGALGGALRLHGMPSLNHHFEVYRLTKAVG